MGALYAPGDFRCRRIALVARQARSPPAWPGEKHHRARDECAGLCASRGGDKCRVGHEGGKINGSFGSVSREVCRITYPESPSTAVELERREAFGVREACLRF